MTAEDLKVGNTYRGKTRRKVRATGEWNDRTILWMNGARVQYDGPAVGFGGSYPTVSVEDFLKWAGAELQETAGESA